MEPNEIFQNSIIRIGFYRLLSWPFYPSTLGPPARPETSALFWIEDIAFPGRHKKRGLKRVLFNFKLQAV